MTEAPTSLLALSGGVGGAKLALGFARTMAPGTLAICANTADDFEHLGLSISPDIDTLMYTLAGLNNQQLGWGLAGDSWQFMERLEALGGEHWFRLGDKDLATHVVRTKLLAQGLSLTEVTRQLCASLGIAHLVYPMSNEPVRTRVVTDEGELSFQRYFVGRQCQPRVSSCHFDGVEDARLVPELLVLLADPALDTVVICPSNPFLSVAPMLNLPGFRDSLTKSSAVKVAVSPIVGGKAIKGPTAKMMAELDMPVSALEVARFYQGLVDGFVIDPCDVAQASSIQDLGMQCLVTNTVMKTLQDKTRLADEVREFAGQLRGQHE